MGNTQNTGQKPPALPDPNSNMTILVELTKRFRLVWLLFRDEKVPLWTKSIPPLSLLYLISPVDFVPDALLGLGQLDDFGVILLGLALFVKLCPPEIVQYYVNKLEYGDLYDDETVDATYRVIDEDEE